MRPEDPGHPMESQGLRFLQAFRAGDAAELAACWEAAQKNADLEVVFCELVLEEAEMNPIIEPTARRQRSQILPPLPTIVVRMPVATDEPSTLPAPGAIEPGE